MKLKKNNEKHQKVKSEGCFLQTLNAGCMIILVIIILIVIIFFTILSKAAI